jgi:hypothetical protein
MYAKSSSNEGDYNSQSSSIPRWQPIGSSSSYITNTNQQDGSLNQKRLNELREKFRGEGGSGGGGSALSTNNMLRT